jgi:hypothetical protein
MSLAIEVDNVTHVLLADGWHTVSDESFALDSYEFLWRKGMGEYGPPLLGGGDEDLIPARGFSFSEGNTTLYGPLTSVLAVKSQR